MSAALTIDGRVVAIQPDETIGRLKERVAVSVGVGPGSFTIVGTTVPAIWNDSSWMQVWALLERDGVISPSRLRAWLANSTAPAPTSGAPDDDITLHVWRDRGHPFLYDLWGAPWSERRPVGLVPAENRGVWPFDAAKPPPPEAVFHDSLVWQDAGMAPDGLVVVRAPPDRARPVPPDLRAQIAADDAAFEKGARVFLSSAGIPSKHVARAGFARIRWKAPYNGSLRALSLEHMFYALSPTPGIPQIVFSRNMEEPRVHKMYAIDKRVVIGPEEYRKWERVSHPRGEPILVLYASTAGLTRPIVRLALTEREMRWTVESAVVENSMTFSLRDVAPVMAELLELVRPMGVAALADILPEWESCVWTLTLKPDVGNTTLTPARIDSLLECLAGPWGSPVEGAWAYRRVSDFGSRRPEDGRIWELLQEGMSTPDILRILPEADPVRVEEIRENNTRAFGRAVFFRFRQPLTLEVHNIPGPRAFDRIRQAAENVFRWMHPKLTTPAEAALMKELCPMKAVSLVPAGAPSAAAAAFPEMDLLAALDSDLMAGEPAAEARAEAQEEKEEEPESTEAGTLHNILNSRLKEHDPARFIYEATEKVKPYAKNCQKPMQPIVFSGDEWKKLEGDNPAILKRYTDNPSLAAWDEAKTNVYVCPDFFCVKDALPLMKEDLVDDRCPVCGGQIIPKLAAAAIRKLDFQVWTLLTRDTAAKFPQFRKMNPRGLKLPCCFKLQHSEDKKVLGAEAYEYVLSEDRFPLEPGRMGVLPIKIQDWLGIDSSVGLTEGSIRVVKKNARVLLRVGVGAPVVRNTLLDIVKAEPCLLNGPGGFREFLSLNNGNLVRLYAPPPDAPPHPSWGKAAAEEGLDPENTALARAFGAFESFRCKMWDDETPLSHIWDVFQREADCRICVFNIDDPGVVRLRNPPFGTRPVPDGAPVVLFVEAGCRFEPVGLVDKRSRQFLLTHETLLEAGIQLVLPPQVDSGLVSKLERPPRLAELPEDLDRRLYYIDAWMKVSAVRTPEGWIPIYPSAAPAGDRTPWTYELAPAAPVADQIALLKKLAAPALAPARLIADSEVETVCGLRVPVTGGKSYAGPLPRWGAAPDKALQRLGSQSEALRDLASRTTEDALRDWVLFEFSEWLQRHSRAMAAVLDGAPEAAVKRFVSDRVAVGVIPPGPIPKFKTVCSASRGLECGGACAISQGVCKVASGPLTAAQLTEWILYAITEDPRKRAQILEARYPRVTHALYAPLPNEVIFSDLEVDLPSGRYPPYKCVGCGEKKELFD